MKIMKRLSVFIILLIIPCYLFCQEGQAIKDRSKKKYIIYSKDAESKLIGKLPDLRILNMSFTDSNNNSVLEGGEQGEIKVLLEST